MGSNERKHYSIEKTGKNSARIVALVTADQAEASGVSVYCSLGERQVGEEVWVGTSNLWRQSKAGGKWYWQC